MSGHDYDIPSRQLVLAQAKTFPAGPFEAVARHRIARGFNGDREPEAGMVQTVGTGQDHQTGVALTVTLCAQGSELTRTGQASRWRESPLPHGRWIDQTVRRCRPLARRALMTKRPFLVAIRARNPWVRLRRNSLGW